MRIKTAFLAIIGMMLAFSASTAVAGNNKYADSDYVKNALVVYFDDTSGELLGNTIMLAKYDDKLWIIECYGANAKLLHTWTNLEVHSISAGKVITGYDEDGNYYKLTIEQVGRKKYQLWIGQQYSEGHFKTTTCINITSIEFSPMGYTFRPSKNIKTGYKPLTDWLLYRFFN